MTRNFAILNDVTKCIGCEECVAACQKIHHLEPVTPNAPPPRIETAADGLEASRWCSVIRRSGGVYVKKQCRHCVEPACVSVCPVGALQKTPEGPVIWDGHRCIGCRYCMMTCPYGVVRFTWDLAVPSIRKCTLCYEEIKSGRIDAPACVTACPTQATIFGTREALLAEAHRRLRAEPTKYIQHVWGEHEVGGTSVLYISHVDLSFLGWTNPRKLSGVDLPNTTWDVLKMVPFEFLGMGALMGSIWWVIERRMRLEREASAESAKDTSTATSSENNATGDDAS